MALVGPDAEHHDKRFTWLINGTAQQGAPVRRLPLGGRAVLVRRTGGYLIWSDIPNNRMLRWVPDGLRGSVSVFRTNSNYSNGNTRDREGRLVTCEHGGRRVTRTEHDGSITVIADSYKGKRLNSPNDVVVKSDGTIWFTDPSYGIMSDYEGHKGEMEQDGCHVYRFDPKSGKLDGRRRRLRQAERPRLLARRVDALRRRLRPAPTSRRSRGTSAPSRSARTTR